MARKTATATDAKANAEQVGVDATVAADASKKNDKRKRTEEAPQAPVKTAPAVKKAKTGADVDDEVEQYGSLVRNYDNSIHITNIPTTSTKEDLTKHFANVGGFVHVLVFHKKSRFGRPPSCSAQIEFSSPQLVTKALEKNNTLMDGMNIVVKAAYPPPAPIPHDTLRFLNLDTSVTEDKLTKALSKWASHLVKVTVPLAEDGVSNRGFAFVKLDNVGWSTEVYNNFKSKIGSQVPTIYYQRTNPLKKTLNNQTPHHDNNTSSNNNGANNNRNNNNNNGGYNNNNRNNNINNGGYNNTNRNNNNSNNRNNQNGNNANRGARGGSRGGARGGRGGRA